MSNEWSEMSENNYVPYHVLFSAVVMSYDSKITEGFNVV